MFSIFVSVDCGSCRYGAAICGSLFGTWCLVLGPILVHGASFSGFILVRGGPLIWCQWIGARFGTWSLVGAYFVAWCSVL